MNHSQLEIIEAAKAYAQFKPLEGGTERHAAYRRLVNALKTSKDYDTRYREGWKAQADAPWSRANQNPFPSNTPAWDGWYAGEKSRSALGDEQS